MDATHGKSNGEEKGVSHALTFSTPIVSTIRIIMLTRRTSLAVVCGGAMGRERRCVCQHGVDLYIILQASEQTRLGGSVTRISAHCKLTG